MIKYKGHVLGLRGSNESEDLCRWNKTKDMDVGQYTHHSSSRGL